MNYHSKINQSIYDVCLQTYGTLDFLIKLMTDNGINGLLDSIPAGKIFVFDEAKAINRQVRNNNFINFIFYSTAYKSATLQTDSGINITTDSGITIKID